MNDSQFPFTIVSILIGSFFKHVERWFFNLPIWMGKKMWKGRNCDFYPFDKVLNGSYELETWWICRFTPPSYNHKKRESKTIMFCIKIVFNIEFTEHKFTVQNYFQLFFLSKLKKNEREKKNQRKKMREKKKSNMNEVRRKNFLEIIKCNKNKSEIYL